jgi:hypothetical protein
MSNQPTKKSNNFTFSKERVKQKSDIHTTNTSKIKPKSEGRIKKLALIALLVLINLQLLLFALLGLNQSIEQATTSTFLSNSACNQPQANPPSYDLSNLESRSSDWGIYCENFPLTLKTNLNEPTSGNTALVCGLAPGGMVPYSNVHCYRDLLNHPNTQIMQMTLKFRLEPPTVCNNQGGTSRVQAAEFAMNIWVNEQRYEFALQWQAVGKGVPRWRYWDPKQGPKKDPWIPIPADTGKCLADGQWHQLILEGDILDKGKTTYRWFSIDQARYSLNIATSSVAVPGGIDKLAVAVQLDGNLKQDPYNLIITQLNLTIIEPTNV